MIYENIEINFSQGTSVMHRFTKEGNNSSVLLIHGYFEDSRIFYSLTGKGFAHYLVANGYDVFVVDLLGKGMSEPKVQRGFNHNQNEIIMRDIPAYLNKIRELTGNVAVHIGGHSWGGVVIAAYLLRMKDTDITSFFTFGSKRRIGRKNLRKFIMIDFGWNWYGHYLVRKYGFLPAKKMKLGNQDEPAQYYKDANEWVYSKTWIDPKDQYNYHQETSYEFPPALFITGQGDKMLGHPLDVKALMDEIKSPKHEYKVIGKQTGHLHDYDHINLLTHKDAVNDHFPLVLEFLRKFD